MVLSHLHRLLCRHQTEVPIATGGVRRRTWHQRREGLAAQPVRCSLHLEPRGLRGSSDPHGAPGGNSTPRREPRACRMHRAVLTAARAAVGDVVFAHDDVLVLITCGVLCSTVYCTTRFRGLQCSVPAAAYGTGRPTVDPTVEHRKPAGGPVSRWTWRLQRAQRGSGRRLGPSGQQCIHASCKTCTCADLAARITPGGLMHRARIHAAGAGGLASAHTAPREPPELQLHPPSSAPRRRAHLPLGGGVGVVLLALEVGLIDVPQEPRAVEAVEKRVVGLGWLGLVLGHGQHSELLWVKRQRLNAATAFAERACVVASASRRLSTCRWANSPATSNLAVSACALPLCMLAGVHVAALNVEDSSTVDGRASPCAAIGVAQARWVLAHVAFGGAVSGAGAAAKGATEGAAAAARAGRGLPPRYPSSPCGRCRCAAP